jgi:hypothetical protein
MMLMKIGVEREPDAGNPFDHKGAESGIELAEPKAKEAKGVVVDGDQEDASVSLSALIKILALKGFCFV